ncbi:MAG TPA: DUF3280 domain-containing protein [Sandaracinaceae bacterium]
MSAAPGRQRAAALVLAACFLWLVSGHAAESPKTLLMLDLELIDQTRPGEEGPPPPVERERLARAGAQLRDEFERNGFYDVIDAARAAPAVERARASYRYLHDCNGCELDIARSVNADRVLTGWVQKVSELILNLNIEIKDAQTGDVVLRKSVDMRGNTDGTWKRAVAFLVRDMREKGQGGR